MLRTHRRALHRIAELDWDLPETAAYLRQTLEALPCRVFSPVGSAVCAYFEFGKPETVAFRSDMDALPVYEQTGLPFVSVHEGRMHACGHDGHMAILLCLAQYLAENPHRATRNVLLLFEPAEETTGGAKALCDAGVLEAHRVSRIYGLHLWPELPKHTVASRAGAMMARSCELTADIAGKSVHLAKWEQGCDALASAASFLTDAYALAEQFPCLLRFGRMESGTARNSVSNHSRLEGSLRCFDDAVLVSLWARLQALADANAAASGCTVTLSRSAGYPPVTNDAALLAQARERFPILDAAQTYITEDFSEYQRRVPGVFFLLGTGGEALHSPKFDFDEAVLQTGLSLFCSLL